MAEIEDNHPHLDSVPRRGELVHRMRDVRLAALGEWSDRRCRQRFWARRPGDNWRLVGERETELAAYDLYLAHPDLTVDVLVIPLEAGDPNNHLAAA